MKFFLSAALVISLALAFGVMPKAALADCSYDAVAGLCKCPPNAPFSSDLSSCIGNGGQSGTVGGQNGTVGGQTGTIDGSPSSPVVLDNPIGISDPRVIIGNVIKTLLGIVGSLALVLFIYGGLMMMTSAGNSDRVSKGRNTLVWASIGLIVIFGSYTIVNYLLTKITQR
jgi:hypothetical protein